MQKKIIRTKSFNYAYTLLDQRDCDMAAVEKDDKSFYLLTADIDLVVLFSKDRNLFQLVLPMNGFTTYIIPTDVNDFLQEINSTVYSNREATERTPLRIIDVTPA